MLSAMCRHQISLVTKPLTSVDNDKGRVIIDRLNLNVLWVKGALNNVAFL